ncbi:MAG TPA: hypothetical protein VJK51_03940 [Candidatus Nanoarchaeia archaeon]|nr:hypothetical protein [Candidatus Nanoarchaeia archaeon]
MGKKGISIAFQEPVYWIIGLVVLALLGLVLYVLLQKDLSAIDVIKQLFRRR